MKAYLKTSRRWYPVLSWQELTKKEQKEHVDDYDGIQESYFFRYRGTIYDLNDCLIAGQRACPILGYYDGIISEGFFSSILVKLSSCGEAVEPALLIKSNSF